MSTRLTYSINHLSTALNAYADGLLSARWGVTISEFTFLAVLDESQPVDITHLAECLGISKAAVSKRVPGLEARGLVSTESDPAHARRVVLRLTDEGQRLAHEAGDVLEAEFARLFVGMPGVDLEATHAAIQTMLDAVLAAAAPTTKDATS